MEKRYRMSPRALETILQPLARQSIIKSQPGAYGGYYILDPAHVTLADIARCFMDDVTGEELLFTHFGNLLLPDLQDAQNALLASLKKVTISELCAKAQQSGLPAELDVCLDYMI